MKNKPQNESPSTELIVLRQATRGLQAPLRLEETLRREFRSRQRSTVSRWTGWFRWPVAAAAMAIILAIVMLRPQPSVPELSADNAGETATDFLPVGYAFPVEPDEFAQVIRIRVPRAEMVRFGIPVNPESGPDRVSADVVLGEDGIARAIRFVD